MSPTRRIFRNFDILQHKGTSPKKISKNKGLSEFSIFFRLWAIVVPTLLIYIQILSTRITWFDVPYKMYISEFSQF